MCVHFPCCNCLAGVQASTCLVVSRVFRSGPQVWLRGGEGRGSLKVPCFSIAAFLPMLTPELLLHDSLGFHSLQASEQELRGNEHGVHQHTLRRAKMGTAHFGAVVPACAHCYVCTKYTQHIPRERQASSHWECAMNTVCWAVVITLG